YDVVNDHEKDHSLRPNQIWAVSLPFTMLDREKEKYIVQKVFEELYTPYGLRSLSRDHNDYHGIYIGKLFDRDMAYHQGTTWAFPLGGFFTAYC
ncbi:amylo-alpha-1,6-glucosidase, partial [Enterococcus faecium]|uniref:amylo-alpha-1,6-glucosidase n=1 Tax=Enterococcus faecium TaxID=1352 RepID=UPI0039FC233A